jgi:hypothetical protein
MPRRKKHKIFILALEKDDPEKELEFELDFQMSLTARQRYEIMDRLVKDGMEFMKRDGHKISTSIVTRP